MLEILAYSSDTPVSPSTQRQQKSFLPFYSVAVVLCKSSFQVNVVFHMIIFLEKKCMLEVLAHFIIYCLLGIPLIIYNIREILEPLVVVSLDVSKYLDKAEQK